MGHDYITYEEEMELFKDSDLWTLRHFLLEEARVMETTQPDTDTTALRVFLEQWAWVCPGVFTGTDLSTYVSQNHGRWELLLRLVQGAGDRIAEFGEFIPLDYLKANLDSEMIRFLGPLPTHWQLLCLGRFSTLLGKHEPPL